MIKRAQTVLLGGLDYFSSLQTSGTHLDSLGPSADYRANTLEVRIETPVSPIVGMTDTISELRALSTYITAFSHFPTTSREGISS
jgi:hypothetical protein